MELRSFRSLVAGQHGVFSTKQAATLGIDSSRLRRMTLAGEISRTLPGVYRLEGAPRSQLQEVAGACLWAGPNAAASHRTAAELLGLCDVDHEQVEISTTRYLRSPNSRILIYPRRLLPPRDLSRISHVSVTTMPRTVIDLAAVCCDEVVDSALDAAIRNGMRRRDFLVRLDELGRKGHTGMALIRRLVAERVGEQGLTASPFERRLLRGLRGAGLPTPESQFVIAEDGFYARVDFAYPDRGLVIEADSYRWHDGRAAFERDRWRISELASRGWPYYW
jgi:Transcriptional regulator, AbiEi antitoxin